MSNNNDEVDGMCLGKDTGEMVKDILKKTKENRTQTQTEEEVDNVDVPFYKMNSNNRGIALIFNHEHFMDPKRSPRRSGTNIDQKKLEVTLTKLGYDVHSYRDLKIAEILQHLKHFSTYNHTKYDSLVVAVLTHGDVNILEAYDYCYNPQQLWNSFRGDVCPTLAGKPKIFILNACQGEKTDAGVSIVETDGQRRTKTLPVEADILVIYSTVEGYFSFRNDVNGSYFLTVLCEELDMYASKRDILTLLTVVNGRIAHEFRSNSRRDEINNKRQMSCFRSSLTKLLKF